MSLSILHRLTGLRAFGRPAAVRLLAGARSRRRPDAYAALRTASSPAGARVLVGLLVRVLLPPADGIRHLFWDTGRGLERRSRASERLVAVAAARLLATVLVWFLFCVRPEVPHEPAQPARPGAGPRLGE